MQIEILLSFFPKITVRRYKQLASICCNWEQIKQTSFSDLQKIGWDENLINDFIVWRNKTNPDYIEKILLQENINCLTTTDIDYPSLLKEIYDPPFCLFVRGQLKADDLYFAIVGTRKFSSYGEQVTEELTSALSQAGINIVSGLALGIDGIAHNVVLKNQGKTIAVLGAGIDRKHIYPSSHYNLSEEIIANGGGVISEYPPGALPSHFTFPRRNRIIAGMSLGVLVIEAGETSGALITAQCALDNNREVFAVPHNITSTYGIGPNNLIKNGAHPITKAEDIIEILNLQELKKFAENKAIIPDSPIEAELLKYLSREPIHIDQLIKQSKLSSPTVMGTLTMMEMKGKIRNLGAMMYVLTR